MKINKFVKSLSEKEKHKLFRILSAQEFINHVEVQCYDEENPLCKALLDFLSHSKNYGIIIDAMDLTEELFVAKWINTIGVKRKLLLFQWVRMYNDRNKET